jgi:hypothetical protein
MHRVVKLYTKATSDHMAAYHHSAARMHEGMAKLDKAVQCHTAKMTGAKKAADNGMTAEECRAMCDQMQQACDMLDQIVSTLGG